MEDLDALLYELLKRRSLTNNEAVILHLTFESLYRRIDDEVRAYSSSATF